MNILSYIVITLFSICHSKRFIPYGFPTGGDLNDASMPVSYEIDIGSTRTSITIYTHEAVWYGIGFGGIDMATATYAVIYSGNNPSETIADYQVIDDNPGNELATNWTLDIFDTSGLANNEPVIISCSRDNDVSDVCSQCYTFDPDAETIQIILAKGTSTTYGYHGDGYNKRGETVNALPDTDPPTEMPTFVPTIQPTKEPTTVPTFEDCVYSDDVIDGVTLRIQRDSANQRVGITMEAAYNNDETDFWFAYGFGAREMNGTYAIIGGVSDTDVQERTLGQSYTFEAPGDRLVTDSIYNYQIINDKQIVTVIRDYTVDGLYDFDRFIECKRPLPYIPVIVAKGTQATFNLDGTVSDPTGQSANIWGYHGPDNREIGTIENMCCVLPSTTLYDISTTFEDTEYSTTEKEIVMETEDMRTTQNCENGEKYTFVEECGDEACDECAEDATCSIDPCGCKAVCDNSMGVMIMVKSVFIVVIVIMVIINV